MSALIDLTGQVHGRLTVLARNGSTKHGRVLWKCRCECGTEKTVQAGRLRLGRTRSCGCLKKELSRKALLKHGHAITTGCSRTYLSWYCAKRRCTEPNNIGWKNYGGRGIRMCKRWLESFENFLADMGERPPGKTLDRYPDNDGDYEPGNCRWATRQEQQANRRKRKSKHGN